MSQSQATVYLTHSPATVRGWVVRELGAWVTIYEPEIEEAQFSPGSIIAERVWTQIDGPVSYPAHRVYEIEWSER